MSAFDTNGGNRTFAADAKVLVEAPIADMNRKNVTTFFRPAQDYSVTTALEFAAARPSACTRHLPQALVRLRRRVPVFL